METLQLAHAWDSIWTAKSFTPDVAHPAIFLSTSTTLDDTSRKAPLQAAGKYGLPLLFTGSPGDGGEASLRSMFPLNYDSDVEIYAVEAAGSNLSARLTAGGRTSFVQGPTDGTAYYVSMCGISDGSSGNDFILLLQDDRTPLTELWSTNASLVRNASCSLVDVFDRVTLQKKSMLAIVGGTPSSGWPQNHSSGDLIISLFDLSTNSIFPSALVIPNASEGVPATGYAFKFPTLTTTSDGKLIVLGSQMAPTDSLRPTLCNSFSIAIVLYHDAFTNQFSATDVRLPSLPAAMCSSQSLFSSAAVCHGDSLYLSRVEAQTVGSIARLDLLSLRHPSVSSTAAVWDVRLLPGGPFRRSGATFKFLNLQREGSFLGLFAVGGSLVNASYPQGSITCVRVDDAPVLPSYRFDPFTRSSALISTSSPFFGQGGEPTVTVTVDFILSNAGSLGLVALGLTPSCTTLASPAAIYDGSEQSIIVWNVTAQSQGLGLNLYLCYSDANTVQWGNGERSMLFTAVNPMEPIEINVKSFVIPGSDGDTGDGGSFLHKNWYYFALGGLAVLTLAAVVVSVIALRRRRLGSEYARLLGNDHNAVRTASGNFDPFASLRISTNSHSSRYITVGNLITMDGEESDVTFIVQRKSDGELFAMKNIPCDGDVERLLSIREFEALNVLQCHPNVVRCIDMYMSYAFSAKRFESSQKSISQAPSVVGRSRALSLNRGSKDLVDGIDEDEEEATEHSAAVDVKKAAISEGRFVCLVMEYHRNGNIAQYLVRLAQRGSKQGKMNNNNNNASGLPKLIDGAALEKLKPPPENLLLCMTYQVVTLLKFMHYESEVSLSHKGLKPENILVCGDLNAAQTYFPVAVSDFGFSQLGNFAPPRTFRKRESDLDSASTRSSNVHGVNTDQLQSPKCDMWSLGCVLYSLATYCFGTRFPPLAEQLTGSRADRTMVELRGELRERGYTKEFIFLVTSLLSVDEAVRPSSRAVHRMFARDHDGAFSIKAAAVAAVAASLPDNKTSKSAFSEDSAQHY